MHAADLRAEVLESNDQRPATCSGHCAECRLSGSALIQRQLDHLARARAVLFTLRDSRRPTVEAEIRVDRQAAFISKLKASCPSRYT